MAFPMVLYFSDDIDGLPSRRPASPYHSWQLLDSHLPSFYNWPSLQQLSDLNKQLCSKEPVGKDGFQVSMNVKHFKPNELHVKVVDNHIVVDAKHEERADDLGYISRHFVRRYTIPKGYDAEKIVSTLSSDGVLTVSAPKPAIEKAGNERIIQIQQTGPAHLNVKQNGQVDKVENAKEEQKES